MKTSHNQRTFVYRLTFVCPNDPRQNAQYVFVHQGESQLTSSEVEKAVKGSLSEYCVYRNWGVKIDCPDIVLPSTPVLIFVGD